MNINYNQFYNNIKTVLNDSNTLAISISNMQRTFLLSFIGVIALKTIGLVITKI